MKRITKKLLAIICLIVCFSLTNIIPAMAEELITDLETEDDFSEDTAYSVLRGNNLNFGTTTVKKLASNKVAVSGITQCHHECDTVYLNLYLEHLQ